VELSTEPWAASKDLVGQRDCVTPNGHKVKHGSGIPTLGYTGGPPPVCLYGRWFQQGPETMRPGPGETSMGAPAPR
jgi:hypothetical protein